MHASHALAPSGCRESQVGKAGGAGGRPVAMPRSEPRLARTAGAARRGRGGVPPATPRNAETPEAAAAARPGTLAGTAFYHPASRSARCRRAAERGRAVEAVQQRPAAIASRWDRRRRSPPSLRSVVQQDPIGRCPSRVLPRVRRRRRSTSGGMKMKPHERRRRARGAVVHAGSAAFASAGLARRDWRLPKAASQARRRRRDFWRLIQL